jgi:hypothetical protein
MLLRASSQQIGDDVDLRSTIGEGEGGGGVAEGERLVRFAEAATRGSDDLSNARADLQKSLEPEAFVLAAATVGIFNGLVRVADSTGIPLDDGTRRATGEFREELGLNSYTGAKNTDDSAADAVETSGDVARLFS